MDDLPPPIKITPDPSNPSTPIDPPVPRQSNALKQVIKFIVKIKWLRVAAYLTSFATVLYLLLNYPPIQNMISHYFPASSPVFARPVSYQGILRGSATGVYSLVLPDQQAYALHFRPSASLTNLKKINEVVVKGHLGWTPYVIENAELYPLNFVTSNDSDSSSPVTPIPQISPNSQNSPKIPDLYSGLTWETSQKRVLIFTSGKRKIEQEGIYLESGQLSVFPQDFINYYIEGLNAAGFKETLNSISPEGVTITYAKDDSYLTFGIKNIYQGSGVKTTLPAGRQVSGYKAFLEHN